MKQVTLAPNLHLVGFGGSVPGFQNRKKVWDGFPFRDDHEYGRDLGRLVDSVFSKDTLSPSDAVILMTHGGPDHCSE